MAKSLEEVEDQVDLLEAKIYDKLEDLETLYYKGISASARSQDLESIEDYVSKIAKVNEIKDSIGKM